MKLHVLVGVSLFLFGFPAVAQETTAPAAVEVPKVAENPAEPKDRLDLVWKTGGSWKSTHEDYVKRARAGKVNLVFFGDSITQWWDWQDFKRRYNKLRGVNFGIGGDKTQNLLWRIQNGEMEGITPKVAVVMIGTNNLPNSSSEGIAAGITRIVQAIHEKSPTTKILLLGIFPRGWDGKQYGKKIQVINADIAKLHNGDTIRYEDLGKSLLEADGSLSRQVSSDSLHLKAEGYRRWATAMEPILYEMLGLPKPDVAAVEAAPTPQ